MAMTEEARKIVNAMRFKEDFECIECPIPAGNCDENCLLDAAANLIESLSEQLDRVTRERDAAVEQIHEIKACRHCVHGEFCPDEVEGCDVCPKNPCPCKSCYKDSNWQWIGVEVEG